MNAKELIVALLAPGGRMTAAQMREALTLNAHTSRRSLRELVAAGVLGTDFAGHANQARAPKYWMLDESAKRSKAKSPFSGDRWETGLDLQRLITSKWRARR